MSTVRSKVSVSRNDYDDRSDSEYEDDDNGVDEVDEEDEDEIVETASQRRHRLAEEEKARKLKEKEEKNAWEQLVNSPSYKELKKKAIKTVMAKDASESTRADVLWRFFMHSLAVAFAAFLFAGSWEWINLLSGNPDNMGWFIAIARGGITFVIYYVIYSIIGTITELGVEDALLTFFLDVITGNTSNLLSAQQKKQYREKRKSYSTTLDITLWRFFRAIWWSAVWLGGAVGGYFFVWNVKDSSPLSSAFFRYSDPMHINVSSAAFYGFVAFLLYSVKYMDFLQHLDMGHSEKVQTMAINSQDIKDLHVNPYVSTIRTMYGGYAPIGGSFSENNKFLLCFCLIKALAVMLLSFFTYTSTDIGLDLARTLCMLSIGNVWYLAISTIIVIIIIVLFHVLYMKNMMLRIRRTDRQIQQYMLSSYKDTLKSVPSKTTTGETSGAAVSKVTVDVTTTRK